MQASIEVFQVFNYDGKGFVPIIYLHLTLLMISNRVTTTQTSHINPAESSSLATVP